MKSEQVRIVNFYPKLEKPHQQWYPMQHQLFVCDHQEDNVHEWSIVDSEQLQAAKISSMFEGDKFNVLLDNPRSYQIKEQN